MINKRFAEIGAADITYLVQESIQEGRTLEYKEALPGNTDKDKKEFLADVSAFANASGGDLIYGISEQRDENGQPTGIPQSVVGLPDVNIDSEIRRLDNIIRDGIEPRVTVQICAIDLSPAPVVIIRIPSSFASPHMVTYKNTSRFYTRNSAGKHQLDVGEIRAAFAASEALPKRIQRFRTERLAKIMVDETPVLLPSTPKIVLHVVPITAFDPQNRLDISHQAREHLQWVNPLHQQWTNSRYNFDGILTYTEYQTNEYTGYLQIFRSGILEAVDGRILRPSRDNLHVDITYIERQLINNLLNYVDFYKALDIEPPVTIMLNLLGISGYSIPTESFGNTYPIDRESLIIPDVLLETYPNNVSSAALALRPIFDTIWQASGYRGSLNYNNQGEWRPRSR